MRTSKNFIGESNRDSRGRRPADRPEGVWVAPTPRTFTRFADVLRNIDGCSHSGHCRDERYWTGYLAAIYGGDERRPFFGYASYSDNPLGWYLRMKYDEAFLVRLGRFAARVRRFRYYVEEVKADWRAEREIHYMDNSTAVVERAADGRTRERTLVGPGGDACF